MSTWLAFSIRHHTPFVWLPAERTKVVTIGALLNKYVFEMFFWFMCFKSRNGLSALWSWKSAGQFSASAEHRVTSNSSWASLCDADLALWWFLRYKGSGESLLRDLEQGNSLRWWKREEGWRERSFEIRGLLQWGLYKTLPFPSVWLEHHSSLW